MIEAKAFRWHGHFEGDLGLYRGEGEIERLRADHDPLKIFTSKTADKLTREALEAIDADVKAQVDDAVIKARAAGYPVAESLLTDVYVSY